MSDETDQSRKPEEPIQEKLSEGGERGRIVVSREVNPWLVLPVGAIGLAMMAPVMIGGLPFGLIRFVETRRCFVVDAPRVDSLARRVCATGEARDAVIIENPLLARALYAGVDLDDEVPPEHYQAVAEVIRYVWSLQGRSMPGERRRDE